ncbi:MAG: BACON domain-containing protein [Bacteroidales bacterium]|nr:BACON domain-containing protein [Bacteroidales bacterium]
MNFIKRISYAFCALLCVALAAACSDDNEVALPSLTVTPAEVTVGAAGGTCTVAYEVKNAVKDAEISVKTDATWLTSFSTVLDGHISFQVLDNWNGKERQATVTVEYPKAQPVTFTVKQSTQTTDFVATLVSKTESTLSLRVSSGNESMRYMAMLMPKSQMDAYQGQDDVVFEDDMAYFKQLAQKLNGNFTDIVMNTSFKGTCETSFKNLEPGTTYCLYCYGISDDIKRTTPISRAYFTTDEPAGLDNAFDINYLVDGVEVTMQVIPENGENGYYFNMLEGEPTEAEILTKMEDYFNQIIALYAQYGYTKEQTMEAILQHGTQQYSYDVCKPNTTYTGFAFAMSPSGVMSKKVTTKKVTTDAVKQSDMTLAVDVTNIKTRTATLKCHPSTDQERYALAYVDAEAYKSLTDEEIKSTLTTAVQRGMVVPGYGDYEESLSGLTPGTAYTVIAMGVNGSYASTPLVRYDFRTNDEREVPYGVNVQCDKYYSADQAADKWGGELENYRQYAIVPVSVSPTNGGTKVYYAIFQGDVTDKDAYPDNAVISNLLGMYTAPRTDIFCPYATDLTLCAVAADEEGNFGTVYREYLMLNSDKVSPIEGYEPVQPASGAARKAQSLSTRATKQAVQLPRSIMRTKALTPKALRMADPNKDACKGAFIKNLMSRVLPEK